MMAPAERKRGGGGGDGEGVRGGGPVTVAVE